MKSRLFSIVVILAVALLLAGPAPGVARAQGVSTFCAPPTAGVANHWSGEGDAQDSFGTANGYIAGVTFAPGYDGQAFTFSGEPSYLDFGADAGNFTRANYTIHFWIRIPSLPSQTLEVMNKREACSFGETNFLDIRLTPQGRLWVDVARWGLAGEWYVFSHPILDSGFHHFALARNGAHLRLYLDGELHDHQITPTPPLNNSAHLLAGMGPCVGADGTMPFRGQLDEIEIVNRTMSPDEIMLVFQADHAGSCR